MGLAKQSPGNLRRERTPSGPLSTTPLRLGAHSPPRGTGLATLSELTSCCCCRGSSLDEEDSADADCVSAVWRERKMSDDALRL